MVDFRDPDSISLPRTGDEFERLCLLVARQRYGPDFYNYGRSGQKQHGIDIYSAYHEGMCLQCKLRKGSVDNAELIRSLKKDLSRAKQKFASLQQFVYAVSVKFQEEVHDACVKLSDDKVQVIPWFWNQLQADIAGDPWLLRYCLGYGAGAQWISDDFVREVERKGEERGWQPQQFYSSNLHMQWYGMLQNWDAPRRPYEKIKQAIADSFKYVDIGMPVAAVVRGEGGSGKSVLLRRLALDLRDEYTVYWISDNAAEFLETEWPYDIEIHTNEKYLLILEDWYRNFTRTGDLATANNLLLKVRENVNVRLLIGDRPSQDTLYPKMDSITFDLISEENATLFTHITGIIPDWEHKFTDDIKARLLKTGLFQLLFVYQYAEPGKLQASAESYFAQIIQSDYKQLLSNEQPFYGGLAHALYVYANLFVDFGVRLSPEALVVLAESYSGVQRPFEFSHNSRTISDDPVMRKYVGTTTHHSAVGDFTRLMFLHDTLAEGWKVVPVDSRRTYGSPLVTGQLVDALKAETTLYDLSFLLYRLLSADDSLLSNEQVLNCCDYLIANGCESPHYATAIFSEELIDMSNVERLDCLKRLISLGQRNDRFWIKAVMWMKTRLDDRIRKNILKELVEAGNQCNPVLVEYFRSLSNTEIEQKGREFITVDRLMDPYYGITVPVVLKMLRHDVGVRTTASQYLRSPTPQRVPGVFTSALAVLAGTEAAEEAARRYLNLPEPEKSHTIFTTCLNMLKEEETAKETARKYLRSPEPERSHQNFSTCLSILKEEETAKAAARKYLKSHEPEMSPEIFTTCLSVLKEEETAKETARKYLRSPEPEKSHTIFTTCLNMLKEEETAKEAARKYLRSPEPERSHQNFTTCLNTLKEEETAKEAARKYLESPQPEGSPQNFITCLKILNDEEIAKITARRYLESPQPERTPEIFVTCLKLLEEDEAAKEAARKYLNSPEPQKGHQSFTTCLRILKDEEPAITAARRYLNSSEPEKTHQIFVTCLKLLEEDEAAREAARRVLQSHMTGRFPESLAASLLLLGVEAVDFVARILKSPVVSQDHRVIYRALCIAAETEVLDGPAEEMVTGILQAKQNGLVNSVSKLRSLYFQMMKVPLFRIQPWQAEADRLLILVPYIHPDLFSSLTHSHIGRPQQFASACLFYIRNWEREFKQPKRNWGYLIRSLAHPSIVEQPNLKEEVIELCTQMLHDPLLPAKLETWIRSIAEDGTFPDWESV